MEQPIQINKYLSESRDEILEQCDDAIKNGLKIHFNSPVGSGKTTMAIDIIESNPDKNFVVLFPQISITEQVKVKMDAMGLDAVMVNNRTIDKVIEDNKQVVQNRIMLSTVDSAYKLIDELNITSEDTVVIMDETHTYLQSPRENHTRTIQAILDGGFPIIGFSATPSGWVNRFLLEVDKQIEFKYINDRNHEVNQTTVKKGLLRTVAEEITSDTRGLVIVFTENKRSQEQLKKELSELDDSIKVCVFNSETKNTTQEQEWKHLMNHDKLTAKYDVYIVNSVAQAGVNITNNEIHRVYLVDSFDPLGFAQYLGRCRNYTKSYHYYSTAYSKQTALFDYNAIEEGVNYYIQLLNSSNKEMQQLLKKLLPIIPDHVYVDNNNRMVANKCSIAGAIYKNLRGLGGDKLIEVTEKLFADIEFTILPELDGSVVAPAKYKEASRKKAHKELKQCITKEHDLINQLLLKMEYENSMAKMEQTIDEHFSSNGTKLLQTREGKLREIFDNVKRAQMSPARLAAINSLYRLSHNDEKVLDELMKLTNKQYLNINNAKKFFSNTSVTNLKQLLEEIYEWIGEALKPDEWRKLLKAEVASIPNSTLIEEKLYKYCLQTKKSNGKQKLIRINVTYEEYLEQFNFKSLTYSGGRLTPR